MTTATTEIPDGERLARVETDVRHLVERVGELHEDNREIHRKIDRNLLWTLGIIVTMWVSLTAMWITTMLTLLNRLGG